MFETIIRRIRRFKHRFEKPYFSLYPILHFYPDDVHYYDQAFLHRSSSISDGEGRKINNERMEYLGDALVSAIVSDILYKHFPNVDEGFLTSTRSKIVQRETLNHLALEIGLDHFFVSSSKNITHNSNVLGNALEALVAAIYLDQGFPRCYSFVKDVLIAQYFSLDEIAEEDMNFKSLLIEWCQKRKLEISFELIESTRDLLGNPFFKTRVRIGNIAIGKGSGYTKKEAQQNVAKYVLDRLHSDKDFCTTILDQKNCPQDAEEEVAVEEPEDFIDQTKSPSEALE